MVGSPCSYGAVRLLIKFRIEIQISEKQDDSGSPKCAVTLLLAMALADDAIEGISAAKELYAFHPLPGSKAARRIRFKSSKMK